jgi:hypothetical protein
MAVWNPQEYIHILWRAFAHEGFMSYTWLLNFPKTSFSRDEDKFSSL